MTTYGTLIQSGRFTSDGTAQTLQIRSDVDFMRVKNQTQIATTQATGRGCVFEWNRGMANNYGIMWTKQNGSNAIDLEQITTGGFLLVDTSNQAPEAAQATSGTDVTRQNPAVVTITSHGYSNGDVVRMTGTTSMLQISGMEFTIGNVSTNDFELSYLDSSGFIADATAGFARRIPFQPQFFPRRRFITNISAATSAVVTMSVTHGYSVGEIVRFIVPSIWGMVEMDQLLGEITAISTANNTITVDIDSSAFTAFAFPASTDAPFTFAQVVPVGDDSLVTSSGATDNQGYIGIKLGAGADGPAGSSNDVIYWEAYKSVLVSNS